MEKPDTSLAAKEHSHFHNDTRMTKPMNEKFNKLDGHTNIDQIFILKEEILQYIFK